MPKSLPDHREILILKTQANNITDTDPLGIAALQSVGDVHGAALTFAGTAQQPLIPTARR